VHTDGSKAEVFRSLRDSRLDDPVSVDRNNAFHSAYIISVGDFSSRKVVTYRIGPLDGQLVRPIETLPPPDGAASIDPWRRQRRPGRVQAKVVEDPLGHRGRARWSFSAPTSRRGDLEHSVTLGLSTNPDLGPNEVVRRSPS
jgi:hypothetical protein